MAVEGDRISRAEFFDEEDLDAALALFDELTRPASRLDNAASRVFDQFQARLSAREWDLIADMLAVDIQSDDRRRVVGAGIGGGRDATIEDLQGVAAQFANISMTSVVVATRGDRLALCRGDFFGYREHVDALHWELLGIVEIDTTERIVASITLEPNDLDAAFIELDSRFLAGEAADHAPTWSAIVGASAAFNRHEPPPTTPDWESVDHRSVVGFASGEMMPYIHATWDVAPHVENRILAVHRLNDVGAIFTQASYATSHQGFDAEWREVALLTIEGTAINRCEVFDEADLDAALARFDHLGRPTAQPPPDNAASRATARFDELMAARDWDGMAKLFADAIRLDDRRRLVGVEFLGREATIANMKASADTGVKNVTTHVVAVRGERLTLQRVRINGKDQRPEAFRTEALVVTEVDESGPDHCLRHDGSRRRRCRFRRTRIPLSRRRSRAPRQYLVGHR